jgi:hypothetical protein
VAPPLMTPSPPLLSRHKTRILIWEQIVFMWLMLLVHNRQRSRQQG